MIYLQIELLNNETVHCNYKIGNESKNCFGLILLTIKIFLHGNLTKKKDFCIYDERIVTAKGY
jgi:hypothetical protein